MKTSDSIRAVAAIPVGQRVQRVGPLSWPQLRIMRRAHAVADWKFGFKIKQVTIVPSDGALGTAKTKGLQLRRLEHEKLTGKHYHDMIVTLLAGEEAQRRFNPRSMRRHGAASDHRSAKEVLIRLHEDAEKECFHAFRYLRARARNFISNPQNWRLIEDLAKALLERRTLTGEEVNDVLQASTRAQMQAWREQRPQP
jgi:ATP-dependent Zn protease